MSRFKGIAANKEEDTEKLFDDLDLPHTQNFD